MKKILFLAAFMVALVGCNRSGTGGYGETETESGSTWNESTPSDTTLRDTNNVSGSLSTGAAQSDSGAPGANQSGDLSISGQADQNTSADQSGANQNQGGQSGIQSDSGVQTNESQTESGQLDNRNRSGADASADQNNPQ
jgi:hypothetical protein